VRALDNRDTLTDLGWELRRVPVDYAERLTAVKQVGEDLMPDLATGVVMTIIAPPFVRR